MAGLRMWTGRAREASLRVTLVAALTVAPAAAQPDDAAGLVRELEAALAE